LSAAEVRPQLQYKTRMCVAPSTCVCVCVVYMNVCKDASVRRPNMRVCVLFYMNVCKRRECASSQHAYVSDVGRMRRPWYYVC
jgi:hypothetical protein